MTDEQIKSRQEWALAFIRHEDALKDARDAANVVRAMPVALRGSALDHLAGCLDALNAAFRDYQIAEIGAVDAWEIAAIDDDYDIETAWSSP